ncbi:MAG TPA: ferric reductase-like transmembrane domain-containing protein [Anaerolineales bacterium]|nr:ferric reductase-like transmembrane domain-containing protein [Anaerolineales bacterium]
MAWLKSHWRWSALNLFASFVSIYVLTQGSTGWSDLDTFDSGLESGKWAVRFLLTSLMMTPLNTYFGWKSAIKLRKSAGLWAFGFACAHALLYIREAELEWLTISMPFYLALGLTGMSILSALAVTSNRWTMKRLGKNWKRLHRLVYVSGIAVVTHAMLATTMSKKLLFRDPQAQGELKVYIAVLAVLLVVRIPLVCKWLKQIPILLKRQHKSGLKVSPVAMPDGGPELWPKIHGRESGVSLQPTFLIPTEMTNKSQPGSSSSPFKRKNGSVSSIDNPSVEIRPEEEAKVR